MFSRKLTDAGWCRKTGERSTMKSACGGIHRRRDEIYIHIILFPHGYTPL
jgi:hypothetical protein